MLTFMDIIYIIVDLFNFSLGGVFGVFFLVLCVFKFLRYLFFFGRKTRLEIEKFFTFFFFFKLSLIFMFLIFSIYPGVLIYIYLYKSFFFKIIAYCIILVSYLFLVVYVIFYDFYEYVNIGLDFQFDGVSIIFISLNLLICYLCIYYNVYNLNIKNYYYHSLNIVLIELFMYFVFLTRDFIVFYIFFESILIPMFFMIGLLGSRNRKIHAGYLFFIYTFVGSLLLLVAIFFMFYKFGSTNIDVIYSLLNNNDVCLSFSEKLLLWFVLFVGFSVKIPMFPVHIWLPEAHVEAPTTGSVILAALLLKLGGFGIFRFLLPICVEINILLKDYIILICVIAVIYASVAALRQIDIKKIIAYSSVVHMNFGFIGVFLNNIDGAVSFIIIMLSHGLVSAGLFFIAGCIYERLGTRNMLYLKGLVQFMPMMAVFFFLLTLSNMSFPGTLSFVSEFLLIMSFFKEFKILSLFIIFFLSGSVFYNIWLVTRVLFSSFECDEIGVCKINDLSYREFRILFTLTALSFIFGTLLCYPLVDLLKGNLPI